MLKTLLAKAKDGKTQSDAAKAINNGTLFIGFYSILLKLRKIHTLALRTNVSFV